METVFNKLGIYDFFNVLVSGGVLLFIIVCVYPGSYKIVKEFLGQDTLLLFCMFLFCYILGVINQEIGNIIEDNFLKVKLKMTSGFLKEENRIIENTQKISRYQKLAVDILKEEGGAETNLNEAQSQYVYSHCIYYVEKEGKSDKIERIRALYGMSKKFIFMWNNYYWDIDC